MRDGETRGPAGWSGVLDRRADMPLHAQVRNSILAGISRGQIQEGRFLTEEQLCERFGVSRGTVQRAIAPLVQQGILLRIQGEGTFLRRRLSEPVRLANEFLTPWISGSPLFTATVEGVREVRCGEELAAAMGLEAGSPLAYLCRARSFDGVRIAVDHRYLPLHVAKDLKASDMARGALTDFLQGTLGYELGPGRMEIFVRPADAHDSADLGVERGAPVLIRSISVRSKAGEALIGGHSSYLPSAVRLDFTVGASDDD